MIFCDGILIEQNIVFLILFDFWIVEDELKVGMVENEIWDFGVFLIKVVLEIDVMQKK